MMARSTTTTMLLICGICLRNELVGINTAIVGPSGGNFGIGFATPAHATATNVTAVINKHKILRAALRLHSNFQPDCYRGLT
jgi:S1-C subfamily serine protease